MQETSNIWFGIKKKVTIPCQSKNKSAKKPKKKEKKMLSIHLSDENAYLFSSDKWSCYAFTTWNDCWSFLHLIVLICKVFINYYNTFSFYNSVKIELYLLYFFITLHWYKKLKCIIKNEIIIWEIKTKIILKCRCSLFQKMFRKWTQQHQFCILIICVCDNLVMK